MKNGARSLLKNLALFLPLALVLYVALLCVLGSVAPEMLKNLSYPIGAYGHMHSRIKEARATKNTDVLFVGSSHAYRGLDTRVFEQAGINSFNLGSSSQTPIQTQILLQRYMRNLNPEVIIYEVNPSSFTSDGVESALDIMANDKLGWDIAEMVWQIKDIRLINSFIFAAFRQLTGADDDFTEEIKKEKDTYIKGGFVEMEVAFFRQTEPVAPVSFCPKPEQWQAFEETVKLLNKEGITLILVQAPVTKTYYQTGPDFEKQMQQYAPYYNFNNRLPLNDSLHFYDEHHLNQHGVTIFNEALIQELLPVLKP